MGLVALLLNQRQHRREASSFSSPGRAVRILGFLPLRCHEGFPIRHWVRWPTRRTLKSRYTMLPCHHLLPCYLYAMRFLLLFVIFIHAYHHDAAGMREHRDTNAASVPTPARDGGEDFMAFANPRLNIAILPVVLGKPSLILITAVFHNGTIAELEEVDIDFGDGTMQRCLGDDASSLTDCWDALSNGTVTVMHTYLSAGVFQVVVNASTSLSPWIQASADAVIHRVIPSVILELVSPSSLVALFEEVIVRAIVPADAHCTFHWDFGDGSGGEYTTVESSGNWSLATHSYGIANTYTVSVKVSNPFYSDEPVVAYLEPAIQAVEPIKDLLLRPISGRYAVPLVEASQEGSPFKDDSQDVVHEHTKKSATVVFEARVWRGSDVEFIFDYGDGCQEHTVAILDVWAAPTGLGKHVYTTVGAFNVSVTATNPLGSVTQNLDQLFYVQVPPRNLTLDKPYYISPKEIPITLEASIYEGTNVSFDWIINDELYLADGGSKVMLNFEHPAVYVVSVMAYNIVTNRTYGGLSPLWTSAKIYVQEQLQDVEVCVYATDGNLTCEEEKEVSLPLDEVVVLHALVFPETETALRFVWELGNGEIKQTNKAVLHHTYRDPESYLVNVSVQNHISSASSGRLKLNLIQKIGNLTKIRHPPFLMAGKSATFHAQFWFGSNLTFEWDFGDGSPPLETKSATVSHIYSGLGEYWIKVMAWNLFSHASVTTNIFVLNKPCQKPEIRFVDERRYKKMYFNDPVIIEIEVTVSCSITSSVIYSWSVKGLSDSNLHLKMAQAYLHQQELFIPPQTLPVGDYIVEVNATMNGTIVTSSSHTHLAIITPPPILTIQGGLMRRVTRDGNITVNGLLSLMPGAIDEQLDLYIHWTCSGIGYWYYPCLGPNSPFSFESMKQLQMVIDGNWINVNLQAVQLNLTISTNHYTEKTTQVLQFLEEQVLNILVDCVNCMGPEVNSDENLVLKARCLNCVGTALLYEWHAWQVLDGYHDHHLGDHNCVNADGSTFFIFAPNSTKRPLSLETNLDLPSHSMANKSDFIINEDLPPFPSLPGFPNKIHESLNRSRRHALKDEEVPLSQQDPFMRDPSLLFQVPVEGDPVYADNFFHTDDSFATNEDSSLMPSVQRKQLSYFDRSPTDFHVTEEGSPGEGGSASARDQTRFGMFHSDHDISNVLEGQSKGREDGGSGHSLGVWHPNSFPFDPVRDDRFPATNTPHLVELPRVLYDLSQNDATSGVASEYLMIKENILRVGSTYLIEAVVKDLNSNMEGSAMARLTVRIGPTNGRCTLMPLNGTELVTPFRLHCLEWQSKYLPIYYQLSYSLQPNESQHIIYYGSRRNVKFVLPAGLSSQNHNVYLNVEVRNSKGTVTRVCSILREVLPLNASEDRLKFIQNITNHPSSSWNKLIAEKNLQGIYHMIHVLATHMNEQYNQAHAENCLSETKLLFLRKIQRSVREKLLNGLMENTGYRKIHILQVLTALSALIRIPQEVTLQMVSKTSALIHPFLEKFVDSDKKMWEAFINLLAQLLHNLSFLAMEFDGQNIPPLLKTVTAECHDKIEKLLKDKLMKPLLPGESVITFNSPHAFVFGKYLYPNMLSRYELTVESSHIAIAGSVLKSLNSSMRCESTRFCRSLPISSVYFPFTIYYPHDTESTETLHGLGQSTLSLYIYEQDISREESPAILNDDVEISIPRKLNLADGEESYILQKNQVNIHIINATEQHQNHSLFISFRVFGDPDAHNLVPTIFIRYSKMPSLQEYNYIYHLQVSAEPLEIFLPPVQETGPYFLAVSPVNPDSYPRTYYRNQPFVLTYSLNVWWEECVRLDKEAKHWTSDGCLTLKGTNHFFIKCRCNVISSYSAFLYRASTSMIPILIDEFCTAEIVFLPICVMILFLIASVVTFWFCYIADIEDAKIPGIIVLQSSNMSQSLNYYLISFCTGYEWNSGTTAKVCIVLHGENGMSEIQEMICGNISFPLFKQGSKRYFLMSTENSLGKLWKIQVWHNNSGSSPSWYLEGVHVIDLLTSDQYCFECNKWLAVEGDQGLIEREIPTTDVRLNFRKVLMKSFREFSHQLNFISPLLSSSPCACFCRCHALCCRVLVVLLTCVASAWYHATSKEVFYDPKILDFTLEPGFVGIIVSWSSLILSHLLYQLFKNSRFILNVRHPTFEPINKRWSLPSFHCWWSYKSSNHSTVDTETASSSSYSNTYSCSSDYDGEFNSLEDSDILDGNDSNSRSYTTNELDYSCGDGEFASLAVQQGNVSLLETVLPQWHEIETWAQRKHQKLESHDIPSLCTTGSFSDCLDDIAGSNSEKSTLKQFSTSTECMASEILQKLQGDYSSLDKDGSPKFKKSREEKSSKQDSGDTENTSYSRTGTSTYLKETLGSTDQGHHYDFHARFSSMLTLKFQLPSAFRILAWALVTTLASISIYYTLMLTLRFNQARVYAWLQSCVIGLLVTYLFVYRLQGFLFALTYAFFQRILMMCQNRVVSEHFCNCNREIIEDIALNRKSQGSNSIVVPEESNVFRHTWLRQRARILHFLRPPPEGVLLKERQKVLKEKKIMDGFWISLSSLVIIFILVILALGKSPTNSFMQNESIKNTFIRNRLFQLNNIKTKQSWWKWINLVFIPSFYESNSITTSSTKTNHSFSGPVLSTGSIAFGCPTLVIFLRMYKHDILHPLDPTDFPCILTSPETTNHTVKNEFQPFISGITSKIKDHKCPLGNTGIQINIPMSRSLADEIIQELQNNTDLLKAAEALVLQFSLFNPATSLFSTTRIKTEFSRDGRIQTSYHVSSVTVYQEASKSQLLMLAEFTFLIMLLWMVHDEIFSTLTKGNLYWKNIWHYIKVIFCLVGVVHFITLAVYHSFIQELIQILQESSHQQRVVDFFVIDFWDQLLRKELGCLLFLRLFLLLEIFEFHAEASHCLNSVRKFGSAVFSFACFFIVSLLGIVIVRSIIPEDIYQTHDHFVAAILNFIVLQERRYSTCLETITTVPWKKILIFCRVLLLGTSVASFATYIKLMIGKRKRATQPELPTFTMREAFIYMKTCWTSFFTRSAKQHEVSKVPIPTEFLLFELESLMDDLLSRVNKLTQDYVEEADVFTQEIHYS